MDRFSLLSDELLIKILLLVPTKVAVSTSVLSKRWEHLWKWLPKLNFLGFYPSSESEMLQCFLNRNLPLHRAPVIEILYLDITPDYKPDNIKLWIEIAISKYLRELEVFGFIYSYDLDELNILPTNLFTSNSLAILKLTSDMFFCCPQKISLPSLKTLHLTSMKYFCGQSLQQFLPNCPILEDLFLDLRDVTSMGDLTVVAPSLESLALYIPSSCGIRETVINTPSLQYFKFVGYNKTNQDCFIENMPNLIKAYIDVKFPNITSIIGSITSVRHLSICSKVMSDEDFVFNQLLHLQICKGNNNWSDLLVQLLNVSPNLQVVDISIMKSHRHDAWFDWKQPSTIPECMLSSLQTFKWEGHIRALGERDVVVYIMKNASHLRTTTIKYTERHAPKFEMRKELELISSRASTRFQLVFEQVLDY